MELLKSTNKENTYKDNKLTVVTRSKTRKVDVKNEFCVVCASDFDSGVKEFECFNCKTKTCMDCLKSYFALGSTTSFNCMSCEQKLPLFYLRTLFDSTEDLLLLKSYMQRQFMDFISPHLLVFDRLRLICTKHKDLYSIPCARYQKYVKLLDGVFKINSRNAYAGVSRLLSDTREIYTDMMDGRHTQPTYIEEVKKRIEDEDLRLNCYERIVNLLDTELRDSKTDLTQDEVRILGNKCIDILNEDKLEDDKTKMNVSIICTNPLCDEVLSFNKNKKGILNCVKCKNVICLTCLCDWKENHVCEEKRIKQTVDYMFGNGNCPGCNIRILRTEGCNHMFCVACKTKFHWMTGELLEDDDEFANPHHQQYLNQQILSGNVANITSITDKIEWTSLRLNTYFESVRTDRKMFHESVIVRAIYSIVQICSSNYKTDIFRDVLTLHEAKSYLKLKISATSLFENAYYSLSDEKHDFFVLTNWLAHSVLDIAFKWDGDEKAITEMYQKVLLKIFTYNSKIIEESEFYKVSNITAVKTKILTYPHYEQTRYASVLMSLTVNDKNQIVCHEKRLKDLQAAVGEIINEFYVSNMISWVAKTMNMKFVMRR